MKIISIQNTKTSIILLTHNYLHVPGTIQFSKPHHWWAYSKAEFSNTKKHRLKQSSELYFKIRIFTRLTYRNYLHFFILTIKYHKEKVKEKPCLNHPPPTAKLQNKISEINLAKEVKDLYAENYKTLTKETQDVSKKWKDISCSWVGGISSIKMAILLKAMHRFNVILSNSSGHFSKN